VNTVDFVRLILDLEWELGVQVRLVLEDKPYVPEGVEFDNWPEEEWPLRIIAEALVQYMQSRLPDPESSEFDHMTDEELDCLIEGEREFLSGALDFFEKVADIARSCGIPTDNPENSFLADMTLIAHRDLIVEVEIRNEIFRIFGYDPPSAN